MEQDLYKLLMVIFENNSFTYRDGREEAKTTIVPDTINELERTIKENPHLIEQFNQEKTLFMFLDQATSEKEEYKEDLLLNGTAYDDEDVKSLRSEIKFAQELLEELHNG